MYFFNLFSRPDLINYNDYVIKKVEDFDWKLRHFIIYK